MADQQIQLKGGFEYDEARAAAAISPGHIIERTAANLVQVHSTEGGYAERAVAIEDALQGNTIDTDYAEDDLVPHNLELPGSQAQVYVKVGEDIDIGDELISAGDGTLIENGSEDSSTTVRQVIAIAMEAQDLTVSGAVDTLTKVRFL